MDRAVDIRTTAGGVSADDGITKVCGTAVNLEAATTKSGRVTCDSRVCNGDMRRVAGGGDASGVVGAITGNCAVYDVGTAAGPDPHTAALVGGAITGNRAIGQCQVSRGYYNTAGSKGSMVAGDGNLIHGDRPIADGYAAAVSIAWLAGTWSPPARHREATKGDVPGNVQDPVKAISVDDRGTGSGTHDLYVALDVQVAGTIIVVSNTWHR